MATRLQDHSSKIDMVKAKKRADHVYFVHPSTDISADISVDMSIDMSADMSVDMSVDISTAIVCPTVGRHVDR